MNNIDNNNLFNDGLYEFVAQTFTEENSTNENIVFDKNLELEKEVRPKPASEKKRKRTADPRFANRRFLSAPGEFTIRQVANELEIGHAKLIDLVNDGLLAVHKGPKNFTTTRGTLEELADFNYLPPLPKEKTTFTLRAAAGELGMSENKLRETLKKRGVKKNPGHDWRISQDIIEILKKNKKWKSIPMKEALPNPDLKTIFDSATGINTDIQIPENKELIKEYEQFLLNLDQMEGNYSEEQSKEFLDHLPT